MRGRFVVILAGVGVCADAGGAGAANTCPAPLGTLVAIEGEVEFREHSGGSWRPAPLNVALCPGAAVRVGDRSRATAALPDAPTYRIDQNTTFHLVSAPAKREQPAVIRLVQGALYIFSRRPRTLKIETPLVDAAVEGTEFLVRAEMARTVVTVLEGVVAARNDRGEARATAGHVAIAEAGQAPVARLIVRPRDAVEWALHYPPILTALADPRAAIAPDLPQPVRDAVRRASRGDVRGAFDRLDAVPAAEHGASFHLHRAALLLSVGRVDEARADIDRALAQDPKAGLAYALRAAIAVAQNDNEAALAAGRRAVELEPQSAAAWIALSYAQQARFDLDRARESLHRAVEAEPKDALAWARLSELWLMAGRRDKAREAAENAADLAPDLARVQSVLGFAALAEFRPRTARQAFERALSRDPADPTSRFGLGLARIRQGDLEAGRNDIEAAVALDPNRSLLRSYLGKAYFEERRSGLAGDQFAIAKELDPKDPTPFLYDAIRKQSENRPVEALRDLERSIELNDNRAVYRSRELLDQDRAARQASLGRIYDDLGFRQLGINQATRSLSLDPGSAAAHRFLSDMYLGRPRHETARVSELLQAQLFQDININPVQPSLSETNLGIITSGGPGRPGFNEFTPLFERNQVQLNVSGEVGSDDTRADEAVVSGLYDRFSISAGQFHYESDGFRRNFDLQHDVYNVFAQAAVTPKVNVQAEVIERKTEEGSRTLVFAPDMAVPRDPNLRGDIDSTTARAGLRLSPSVRSDLIASFIYTDSDLNVKFSPARDPSSDAQDAIQGETRYLFRSKWINSTTGLYVARVRQDDQTVREKNSGYTYLHVKWPTQTLWTLGLSFDDYQSRRFGNSRVNPKLGLEWQVKDSLLARFAVFHTLKSPRISSRTIEPTQIAGFNQLFDESNATVSWTYGAGLDARLTDKLYGGLELTRRDQDDVLYLSPNEASRLDRDEDLYKAYLYWVPSRRWAVHGGVQFDVFDREEVGTGPTQMETLSLPIGVSYFHPSGLLGGLGATYLHQHVKRPFEGETPGSPGEGSESFMVVDASIGYRIPRRLGFASLEVRNLFDSEFRYQDDSFREFNQEPTFSPFVPSRLVLARVALSL